LIVGTGPAGLALGRAFGIVVLLEVDPTSEMQNPRSEAILGGGRGTRTHMSVRTTVFKLWALRPDSYCTRLTGPT
jgi:hypothetical protein